MKEFHELRIELPQIGKFFDEITQGMRENYAVQGKLAPCAFGLYYKAEGDQFEYDSPISIAPQLPHMDRDEVLEAVGQQLRGWGACGVFCAEIYWYATPEALKFAGVTDPEACGDRHLQLRVWLEWQRDLYVSVTKIRGADLGTIRLDKAEWETFAGTIPRMVSEAPQTGTQAQSGPVAGVIQ